MKIRKILIIIALSSLCIDAVTPQAKPIYWVHGMGGNSQSLKEFADYFGTNYNAYMFRAGYRTDLGITGSAQSLSYDINANSYSENIIIAHSMGGVNSIELYRQKNAYSGNYESRYVGGIITLASPINGAFIANNIDNGVLDDFITEAVDKGSKGARSEPAFVATWLASYVNAEIINRICGTNYSNLRDLLYNLPVKMVKEEAEKTVQSAATKNSLKTNSTEIDNIQNSGFIRPSIAIYGVEDSPAFIRLVSSRKDANAILLIELIYQTCQQRYSFHNNMYYACLATLQFAQAAVHSNLASKWKTSRDYWNGQFQKSTDVLIGAYRTVTQTVEYWDYECNCSEPLQKILSCDWPCPPEYQVPVLRHRTVTTIIEEESDGLLVTSTQKALPGCLRTIRTDHINHEEMKTHSTVKAELEKIFLGTTYTDRDREFFILDEKN
ncbi:MAG: hypothetical protein JW894_13870 [Bacteroidales bacterium]|nr:hypothetical protein [Bacteroidales bacterium]